MLKAGLCFRPVHLVTFRMLVEVHIVQLNVHFLAIVCTRIRANVNIYGLKPQVKVVDFWLNTDDKMPKCIVYTAGKFLI